MMAAPDAMGDAVDSVEAGAVAPARTLTDADVEAIATLVVVKMAAAGIKAGGFYLSGTLNLDMGGNGASNAS